MMLMTGFFCKPSLFENGAELMYHLNQISEQRSVADYPRFILLDLNMPKKDGFEVLKELKESEIFRMIPVIVFTTTKNQHEIRRCYEFGANSYMIKPAMFDEWVKTIGILYTYWFSITSAAN
jgi:CheY-like chemotaxis protein